MNQDLWQQNKESIEQLENLLFHGRNSENGRIIVFAGAAVSMHPPSRLPTADEMLRATLRVLLQDPVLGKTLRGSDISDQLYRLIDISSTSQNRFIPPEMFYDAIYEFAGKKVFSSLDCLRSKHPNLNHKILASLLDRGFIDHIVTTNFDTLIEQCMTTTHASEARVWKIHGDIRIPSSMVTTMRRVGQAAFDEELVTQLKNLLEGSHVIFIGYSGMDPDLMPAFQTARMKSVYWCVFESNELDPDKQNSLVNRQPCKTIRVKTPIRWIVGDLQQELLVQIAKKIPGESILNISKRDSRNDQTKVSPLQVSIRKWERSFFRRLSPVQKARAILQILYYIGLYSTKPHIAWIRLIESANAMEKDQALSKSRRSEFARDLHAFRAEAYLKLAEGLRRSWDLLLAQSLQNRSGHPDLTISRHSILSEEDVPKQFDEVLKDLYGSSLNIKDSKLSVKVPPAKQIEQLFVRSKDHLTTILPWDFKDAVQVQALLNASTILVALESRKNQEKAIRNLEGAETMLEQAIGIADQARIDTDKRNTLKARCYSNFGVLFISRGDLHDGLKSLERAERLFKESGDLYGYIVTCINIGWFLLNMYISYRISMYKDEAAKYHDHAQVILHSYPNRHLSEEAENLLKALSQAG